MCARVCVREKERGRDLLCNLKHEALFSRTLILFPNNILFNIICRYFLEINLNQ